MCRIHTRAVLAAIPLVSVLVGCDGGDGGRADVAPVTVVVGGVLEAFPPTTTVAPPPTPAPPPSTSEPDRTATRRTTTTTPSTMPATTMTAARTSLTLSLADIVAPSDGSPPGPTDRLTDDTGRLSMDLPTAWSERATSTGRLPDGSAAPYLAASADMGGFLDGYDAAGITAVVLPGAQDLAAALESYRFEEDCRPTGARPYVGERVEGEFRVVRDCGGTDTDILTVVAEPPGNVGIVLLLAQIREIDDLVAVDAALDSMTVRRP